MFGLAVLQLSAQRQHRQEVLSVMAMQPHSVAGGEPSADHQHRELLLLKLGGAVLTDKAQHRVLRRNVLPLLARAVAGAALGDDGALRRPVVVVHGAGSFAHFEARDHALSGRHARPLHPTTEGSRLRGLARGSAGLAVVHAAVLDALETAGLPAASCPLAGLGQHTEDADGGVAGAAAAAACGERAVAMALPPQDDGRSVGSSGGVLMPVLHGDFAALHRGDSVALQPTVVSGDTLVTAVARAARARGWHCRTVFVTDVVGVFTADPRTHSDATLVRRLFVDPRTGVMSRSAAQGDPTQQRQSSADGGADDGDDRADVTGAMKGKVAAAGDVACAAGRPVHITALFDAPTADVDATTALRPDALRCFGTAPVADVCDHTVATHVLPWASPQPVTALVEVARSPAWRDSPCRPAQS